MFLLYLKNLVQSQPNILKSSHSTLTFEIDTSLSDDFKKYFSILLFLMASGMCFISLIGYVASPIFLKLSYIKDNRNGFFSFLISYLYILAGIGPIAIMVVIDYWQARWKIAAVLLSIGLLVGLLLANYPIFSQVLIYFIMVGASLYFLTSVLMFIIKPSEIVLFFSVMGLIALLLIFVLNSLNVFSLLQSLFCIIGILSLNFYNLYSYKILGKLYKEYSPKLSYKTLLWCGWLQFNFIFSAILYPLAFVSRCILIVENSHHHYFDRTMNGAELFKIKLNLVYQIRKNWFDNFFSLENKRNTNNQKTMKEIDQYLEERFWDRYK